MIRDKASNECRADPGLNHSRRNRVKKWSPVIIRSLLSLALLVVLFALADLHAILELLRKANMSLLLLVMLWMLLDRLLHGWRWILLLRAKMRDISVLFLIRVHFISNFMANFLPFNIGNDITRIVGVAKHSGNTLHPLSSVVVDRIIGLVSSAFAVALVVTVGLIWRVSVISPQTAWTILGLLTVLACSGLVVWKGRLIQKILPLLRHRAADKWISKIAQAYDACMSYGTHRNVIFKVFVLHNLSSINGILTTYVTARALDIDVSILDFFLYVPIISFLGLLPISANGIGIMEGGFVFFFSQVGASTSEALILGLAKRVLLTLVTLPGALLLAMEGWSLKKVSTTKASTV